jgi:hypothetical protein
MHPEFLREMTDQRVHERRAQAHETRLARLAIRHSRRGRNVPDKTDGFVVPPIPDYVDGSFRTEPVNAGPADTEMAGEAGQAPAAHRAA